MEIAAHTQLKPGADAAYEVDHGELPPQCSKRSGWRARPSGTISRSSGGLFHVLGCYDDARRLALLDAVPLKRAWEARMALLLDFQHDHSRAGAAQTLPVVWRL